MILIGGYREGPPAQVSAPLLRVRAAKTGGQIISNLSLNNNWEGFRDRLSRSRQDSGKKLHENTLTL